MSFGILRGACLAAGLAVLLAVAPPAAAETSNVGATSIGVEAGLPLVVGLDLSHRLNSSWRLGLGLSRIAGLTAVRAEARWMLRAEARGAFVPSLIAGAEQYFLSEGGDDATPLGVHAALGLDWYLDSPVSIGVRIGGLKTFGSSDGGDIKVFSVQNGFSSGTFNFGVRYHF
jgi:hypothetical protein